MADLGIAEEGEYRQYLDGHPSEWAVLYGLCRVTISRFCRDRRVFDVLSEVVLPELAARIEGEGGDEVECWSAGCGSGEEPYSLRIAWEVGVEAALRARVHLRITATDADPVCIERAAAGRYKESSLRQLPEGSLFTSFRNEGDHYVVRDEMRRGIDFVVQDIRLQMPSGPFHVVLCRNLVFTYFDEGLQQETADRLVERLQEGGYLIIGVHESLSAGTRGMERSGLAPGIYRRVPAGHSGS